MYYVTFTGSRLYENWKLVFDVLEKESQRLDLFVKVGDCPTGLDLFVAQWCYAMDMFKPVTLNGEEMAPYTAKIFEANWSRHGKKAGPIRNHEMVNWERTDKVIAFPAVNSRGTWECCEYSHNKSIPVEFPELVLENHYVDTIVRTQAKKYS